MMMLDSGLFFGPPCIAWLHKMINFVMT